MSTRRRRQHQEKVLAEQLATALRRTLDTLRSTGRGPYAPGPWWPEDHPKHQAESGCGCSFCRAKRDPPPIQDSERIARVKRRFLELLAAEQPNHPWVKDRDSLVKDERTTSMEEPVICDGCGRSVELQLCRSCRRCRALRCGACLRGSGGGVNLCERCREDEEESE